jgi:hypothetical protein
MSACVWSAFDNLLTGPRWATITSNGTIIVLHVDGDGWWDGHFTDREGGNFVVFLGAYVDSAKRDAIITAESL